MMYTKLSILFSLHMKSLERCVKRLPPKICKTLVGEIGGHEKRVLVIAKLCYPFAFCYVL